MKKLTALLLMIILAVSAAGCGTNKTKPIVNTDSKKATQEQKLVKNQNINKYDINVDLNEADRVLSGETNVSYINNENIPLDKIYFHIYPNAYKREATSPVAPEDFQAVYPGGFKPGSININHVTNNNKNLQYNIEGKDETILGITLQVPLKPGKSVDISIGFEISIPPANDRLGYGDDFYNFGNWYPIAAVYDESGWNLDAYYAMGDPFYSDISDYKVSITVPDDIIVAATGEEAANKVSGNKRTYTFEENSVRDFAWVASNKFNVDVKSVDGIQIKSYCLDGSRDRNEFALASAENSVRIFDKAFGKYPYKTLSIVATHFMSGMEYPGIVFINKDYYYNNTDKFYLEVTVAHEVAHQWWYSVVGNNEVDEAWVDESLAAYSEVIYYEKTQGKEYGDKYMQHEYTEVYNSYKNKLSRDEIMLQPVFKFKNSNDYALLVYYKGAMMHNAIREKVGDDVFFKILQTYYNKYKFKNATSQDYINIVEDVTGKQWDDFFNEWLMNK